MSISFYTRTAAHLEGGPDTRIVHESASAQLMPLVPLLIILINRAKNWVIPQCHICVTRVDHSLSIDMLPR